MSRPLMLITGGAGGIGFVTAREFAKQGHDIIIFDVPALERSGKLEELAESISKDTGVKVLALGVDVADVNSVKRGFRRLNEEHDIKSLNVLILNAAKSIIALLEETDEKQAGEVLDSILKGAVNVTVNALPLLQKSIPNASLLAVSSIASLISPPFLGIYAAAKAGLDKLMDCWRLELEPMGIHVGVLHVGATNTGMVRRAYMSPTIKQLFAVHQSCQGEMTDHSRKCKIAKEFVNYVERPHQESPETVARVLYQMMTERVSQQFVTKSDERQFRLAKRLKFMSKRWFRNVSKSVLEFRSLVSDTKKSTEEHHENVQE